MLSTRHYTIPVFIPELACPFQCAFCNQEKISGKCNIPEKDEIITIIEDYLGSFTSDSRYVEVGFFGGSFTGINIEKQRHYLEIIQPYLKNGQIDSIRISTRPDYISEDILDVLGEMNVGTIELGAQSFDDEVLKKSKRGHTSEQISEAAHLILKHQFKLGLQMMIGLPEDNLEKAMYTAKMIVKEGAENTRIYPALVIKDTLMHSWYKEGKYIPLSMEEAIHWTSKLLLYFEENNVNVIRVGLHPSEGLLSGDEYIDGPFHPSFRELVLTRIWKEILEKETKHTKNRNIIIEVSPKELNYSIGHNSSNRQWLEKKFTKVIFRPNDDLRERQVRIL